MTRVGRCLLVTVIACATTATADAARAKNGVFGVINGMAFKATNVQGAGDPCVFGIYNQTQGVLVFSALECKPRRRRQGAVRKNYQTIVMACNINFEMPSSTTRPLAVGATLACPSSAYTETKTGRFHIPKSTATWNADTQFLPDFSITSNLKVRIDSFDGSVASGVISGSFDDPLAPNAAAPAAVQGEITFRFPFQVQ
jgi:hypothetical protein